MAFYFYFLHFLCFKVFILEYFNHCFHLNLLFFFVIHHFILIKIHFFYADFCFLRAFLLFYHHNLIILSGQGLLSNLCFPLSRYSYFSIAYLKVDFLYKLNHSYFFEVSFSNLYFQGQVHVLLLLIFLFQMFASYLRYHHQYLKILPFLVVFFILIYHLESILKIFKQI